jgi:hypothetical protein
LPLENVSNDPEQDYFADGMKQWADEYNQVKTLGSIASTVRTPEQTEIGLFWTDHTGRQYARAYRALAVAYGLSLYDSARLFAMLYSAAADSFIGCMNAKIPLQFLASSHGHPQWKYRREFRNDCRSKLDAARCPRPTAA